MSLIQEGKPVAEIDKKAFVLGLDLDGCVADFYGHLRGIFSEWSDKPLIDLPEEVKYGLPEWGLRDGEYDNLHRYAVTQQKMFEEMEPIKGAPQSLRVLSHEGVHIRIITHRLFIDYFHEPAASQTIRWLEKHGIPYKDLCLIEDKSAVMANIYIEDKVENVQQLESANRNVICFTNSTNRSYPAKLRADTWDEATALVRKYHAEWREQL